MSKLDYKITTHGFRSAFRDWVGEVTNFPNDAAELALAHKVTDRVEAAYRRGIHVQQTPIDDGSVGAYCAKLPVADAKVLTFAKP